MKGPLLIVGGSSLIGRALVAQARQSGEPVLATVRTEPAIPGTSIRLDLAEDPWPVLPQCRAAVLCAAITSQDQCRRNPAATREVNVTRTLKLIRQLVDAGTFTVFLSTNLVFDGSRPDRCADEPRAPGSEYGRHKAEVEQALAQWPDRTAIVRLTKVFHPQLPLLQKWVENLNASHPVNAFSDYICSPVNLDQVVAGIVRIALERRAGLWQFSGPADLSYADLARLVARHCAAPESLVRSQIAPVGLLEHSPAHTTLDATRAREELNLVFPGAAEVLTECLSPPS